jgi:hypothetical protein
LLAYVVRQFSLNGFKLKSTQSDRVDLYLFYVYYGVTIFNLIISTFSERFSTRYASELSGIVSKGALFCPLFDFSPFLYSRF